jgi:TonB family protein
LRRACLILLALPFLFQTILRGQDAAKPNQDAASLIQRLHAADVSSALDTADMQPWHLKMTVQLFDDKGKPSDQGSIEEWWAGPNQDKRVYTLPSYTATFVHADGKIFRTPGASHPPSLLELLLRQAMHPMPTASEFEQAQPQMSKINLGKAPLECVMLAQPIKGLKSAPLGLFPTYCFDPGKDALRLTYNFGTELVVRNAIGTFQQKLVSTDVVVRMEDVMAAEGKVAMLQAQDLTSADLATDGLEQVGGGSPQRVPAGVIAGMARKMSPPVYPPNAKANHVTGVVTLHAVIGTDGHIYDLSVLSSPDPDLAIAAIAAVRRWTYKPYLLSGEPTEVETTINVNFSMK